MRALGFYQGLTARPLWAGPSRPSWAASLESHLPSLQSELSAFLSSGDSSLWSSLGSYNGSDTGWHQVDLWSHFSASALGQSAFPRTCALLRSCASAHLGPRHVAVARQDPGRGIGDHCDMHNWMLTLHLPLQAGRGTGAVGIVVDGVRREWEVGRGTVMDTTFVHSTYNDGKEPMYLLMVDFWHPELSGAERKELEGFWRATTTSMEGVGGSLIAAAW